MFEPRLIGKGLLAVPGLAGPAAYAVSDAFSWKQGLSRSFYEARALLAIIIIVATVVGTSRALEVDVIKSPVSSAFVMVSLRCRSSSS